MGQLISLQKLCDSIDRLEVGEIHGHLGHIKLIFVAQIFTALKMEQMIGNQLIKRGVAML